MSRPSLRELFDAAIAEQDVYDEFMERLRRTIRDLYHEGRHFKFQGDGFFQQIEEEIRIAKDELEPRVPAANGQKRRISGRQRRRIFERDAYRCVNCGTWRDLTIDHIHPESLGGSDDDENIQTLCMTCNCRKGTSVS